MTSVQAVSRDPRLNLCLLPDWSLESVVSHKRVYDEAVEKNL